jgi:hypothetical protein
VVIRCSTSAIPMGVIRVTGYSHLVGQTTAGGDVMKINWRKDVDKALEDARASARHLLLDFSAAPM